jgi:crotonobetainyl-CoA:carnitine CoA-transferase CaiB-like acyl-CoA transferase
MVSFLDGVRVAADGELAPVCRAVRLLCDLGAQQVSVEDADVVISDRARAGDARVWVAVTPFGLTGPRSTWRGSDLGVLAASGNLWATGDADRPPVRSTASAAYAHVAPEVAFASVSALASGAREVDVDVSMQEVVCVANMGGAGRAFRSGARGQRAGASIGRTREIWRARDGWVSFGLRGGPARVRSLETLASLGALPVRDWALFDHTKAPADELRELQVALDGWFASMTVAELHEIAASTNAMLAPICGPHELHASKQLAARDFFAPDGQPRRWAHFTTQPPSGVNQAAPSAGLTPERPARAWEGVRIVELGAGAAGPIATRYFAEHGATVVRIESATRPDFLRAPVYADMFDALNCGKRSVALNLKDPAEHALAKRLIVEWADAVCENFAPKALRGLGLAYDDLVADRPDLVMVSACLNGQTGPHRDYPGFGGQGSALSGWNHFTGWPDREPVGPFGTITDSLAPRFVALALGAALLHRERTGEGSYVDVSQVECAAWSLGTWDGGRFGNGHLDALLHGVFPCAGEDRWVAIACWTDEDLANLHAIVGAGDDLEGWTAERSPLEAATELQAHGVEAVPVHDFLDVRDDPQLAHRGHLVALTHPELGEGRYERNGFRLRGDGIADGAYDRTSPLLGQDDLAFFVA